MKINYSDPIALISNCGSIINSEFSKQVIKDGGQLFLGIVSPTGVRMQIAFNNKEFDKMINDDEEKGNENE